MLLSIVIAFFAGKKGFNIFRAFKRRNKMMDQIEEDYNRLCS